MRTRRTRRRCLVCRGSLGNGAKWLGTGIRMAAQTAVRPQVRCCELRSSSLQVHTARPEMNENDAENKELFWAFCQFAKRLQKLTQQGGAWDGAGLFWCILRSRKGDSCNRLGPQCSADTSRVGPRAVTRHPPSQEPCMTTWLPVMSLFERGPRSSRRLMPWWGFVCG